MSPRVGCVVLLLSLGLSARPAPTMAQNTDTAALINEALDQPISLSLGGTLPQALSQIADKTGVRIEPSPAVWELLPWGQQTSIQVHLENQTLRQGLQAITQRLGLRTVLKDQALALEPVPALARIGRRATPQELAALETMATTPLASSAQRPTIKQLVAEVDAKLEAEKSASAIENRYFEGPNQQATIWVPRNASLMDALDLVTDNTPATWYPWGTSIVILGKEDHVRNMLNRTITVNYRDVDVAQILMELSRRAGVDFQIEPGAIQQVRPECRRVRLLLDNSPIRDALQAIAGTTGLSYTVTDNGLYFAAAASAPIGPAETIVGTLGAPGLGIRLAVPPTQLSTDERAFLQQKLQQQLSRLRQQMTAEGFHPTSQPTSRPAEDL